MKKTMKWFAACMLVANVGFVASAHDSQPSNGNAPAPLTVTTACGNTYTFEGTTISQSSRSDNGVTTSEVYVDGKLVFSETCDSKPAEPFDICKFIPWFCK